MNKKPMRWRRARFPDEGTRWSTPMKSAKSVLEKLDAAKGAAMSVLGARR